MNKILNQIINLTLIALAIHESAYSDDSDVSKISGDIFFVLLLMIFAVNGKKLNDSASYEQENNQEIDEEEIVNEMQGKPSTKEICQIYNRNFIAAVGMASMLAGLIFDQTEDINSKYYRIFTYDIPLVATFISQMAQLASDMLCEGNKDILRRTDPISNIARLNYCRYLGTGYQIALSKNPSPFATVVGMAGVSLDIGAHLYKAIASMIKTHEESANEESENYKAVENTDINEKAPIKMKLWNINNNGAIEIETVKMKQKKSIMNLPNVSVFKPPRPPKQHPKPIEEVKIENEKKIELGEKAPVIISSVAMFKQHKKSIEEVEIKNESKLALEIEEKAETLNTAGNANAKI